MKGHMQDGKFHPHTQYKGVRKSRDQSEKTKGIRFVRATENFRTGDWSDVKKNKAIAETENKTIGQLSKLSKEKLAKIDHLVGVHLADVKSSSSSFEPDPKLKDLNKLDDKLIEAEKIRSDNELKGDPNSSKLPRGIEFANNFHSNVSGSKIKALSSGDKKIMEEHLKIAGTKSGLEEVGKLVQAGQWIGGKEEDKWFSYDSVTVKGKKFDTNTTFTWDDPDFPHDNDIEEAKELVEKHNKKEKDSLDPETAWVDVVFDLPNEGEHKRYYTFKVESFLIMNDGDIQVFTDADGVGRLDLKDLENE